MRPYRAVACLPEHTGSTSTYPVLRVHDTMPIAVGLNRTQNVNTMVQIQRRPGRERRTYCRYRMNAPTLVRSESAGIAAGLVLEASTSGLCLSLPFRLPVNSGVKIQLEDNTVSGLVRNCVCIRAMEFHVGIEIPPSSSGGDHDLNRLRRLQRARALNLYSAVRANRVWSSPA